RRPGALRRCAPRPAPAPASGWRRAHDGSGAAAVRRPSGPGAPGADAASAQSHLLGPQHAGLAIPVAVTAVDGQRRQAAVAYLMEAADDLGHAFGARAEAQDVGAGGAHLRELGQQVADLGRHGLDTVDGEHGLALLAQQGNAFGIVLADEL